LLCFTRLICYEETETINIEFFFSRDMTNCYW